MTLQKKILLTTLALHAVFFCFSFIFRETLGFWFLLIEFTLVVSFLIFVSLIRKALQPLEYIDIFSTLLKEGEFTSRFSYLNQPDLDSLISQFNILLEKLHRERITAGERHHVFEKLMNESTIGVLLLDTNNQISEFNDSALNLLQSSQLPHLKQSRKTLSLDINIINQNYSLDKIGINQHQLVSCGNGKRLKISHYQFRDRGFYRSFYLIEEFTLNLIKTQKESYENLIKTMSHEVNNTIAITNSLLESCLGFKKQLSQESGDDFEKALKIVINRSHSLNQFMQGYSDIVKLQKPVKAKLKLTKLVENLSELFYSEMIKNDIHLTNNLENDLEISADSYLIEQVLINILKNAIEAIEDNPQLSCDNKNQIEINLKTCNDSNLIQLDIIDSGCGISSKIKNQLFTPFFTTKATGQGIGLMLIDEILTSHEFRYQLANNIHKNGAYFRIYFNNQ